MDLNGPLAADAEPPRLTFDIEREAALALVTVTATDEGSGVAGVYYSLDGSHFQPYTGPLTLDPIALPLLNVYADDLAATHAGESRPLPDNPAVIPWLFLPVVRR